MTRGWFYSSVIEYLLSILNVLHSNSCSAQLQTHTHVIRNDKKVETRSKIKIGVMVKIDCQLVG